MLYSNCLIHVGLFKSDIKTLVIVELTLKITYQHALYVLYLKIRRWNIVPCDDIFLNQAIFGKGHIMKSKAAFIASYSKQGNCLQWFLLGIGRFSNNGNHLAITPVCLLKIILIIRGAYYGSDWNSDGRKCSLNYGILFIKRRDIPQSF